MSEVIFDDSNFESEVIKSDKPVLVDFFASWCGPCKMQGPIVEEVANVIGDKAKVGKMDVDGSPVTAQKFGIMSIPTIMIFKGGQSIKTFVGVQDKQSLIDEINKVI